MKFKTDENLPAEVAERSRQAGFDAMTVVEQRLTGAPDARVAEVCRGEARVLVTLDLDFADIRAHPPGTGPGVIILRPRSQARIDVLSLAARVIAALGSESVSGNLWIVDEQRLRIREQ
jgi:predicted nuclease of predicted toxin-antitoxin system